MTYSKTLKTYHNHVPTRSNTSQHVPNRSKMLWHHITSITRIHIIQLKEPLQNQRRIWIRFLSRPTWSTTRISSSSGRPKYFDFKSCQVPSSGRVIFQSKTLHWKMLWKSLSRTYILKKTMRSTTTSACLERGACWGWNVESKETASIDVNLARI
jgi:hypothetical protein